METGRGATIRGDVVAKAHLGLVVLPPHGGRRLVEVLAVEADTSEGVLAIAQLGKGQEDALHAIMNPVAIPFLIKKGTFFILSIVGKLEKNMLLFDLLVGYGNIR